jgi:hypothetical protein
VEKLKQSKNNEKQHKKEDDKKAKTIKKQPSKKTKTSNKQKQPPKNNIPTRARKTITMIGSPVPIHMTRSDGFLTGEANGCEFGQVAGLTVLVVVVVCLFVCCCCCCCT